LIQEIANLKSVNAGLVDELKNDRQTRQGLKDKVETLETALTQSVEANADPEEDKIKDVVVGVLADKDASRAGLNKKAAIEKFVIENKEFHPENDVGGIKLAALERKLAQFSLEGVSEVNDFLRVIGEANTLLGRKDTAPESTIEKEVKNPYSSTPQSTIAPTIKEDETLTADEKRLMEQAGFTREKYLELKEKMPRYISKLLESV